MRPLAVLITILATLFHAHSQPANDNFAGATSITHSSNNCSANGAYTTIAGTADMAAGSCWENGPNYNVWFSFVATTTQVTLDLKVGGAEGTLQHPNMALWQADGTTEIKCVRRINATTDVQISTSSLTIGNTYYVSVDNYVGLGYRGTFTLCIDNTVTNDDFVGAVTLTHSANNCSLDGEYTTINATADLNAGSCWENGPNYNRWFKFVATTANVTLDLKVGGAEGTMQHPNMALWQSDGTTEVKCVRRINATTDVQISTSGLTIGNTYYVSVDNYVGLGYRGTFTLCIDNTVTNDDYAGALTLIHSANNCSLDGEYTTVNATPDLNAGSCWENGPNYNRWFKFVATTANVTLDLKVDGAEGTMQHPNMALWQSDGTTEVKCVRRINATTDVQISTSTLTIGNTYYVSVDNYVGLGYRGTFTLCIDNTVTYDDFAGAITIVHSANNCSLDGEYTTLNATADLNVGSCWENGPNYNRWFRFVATTQNVTLDLKVGGAEGTMQHPNMALWQSDGTTEVKCVRRIDATTDVQISTSGLTIGNVYYVSVDNYVGLGYRGTFTLCIDNSVTYDEVAGAILLADINNWCSADAAFTTVNATPDGLAGSCWENGPNYNRWFKFVATTNFITVDVKVAGAEGTLQHPNVALWQSDAVTEINCMRRVNATTDVQVSATGLVIGNTYYVSVDNYVGLGYRGTFTLCANSQPSYDFYEGAIELTDLNNWCSANAAYTTVNATADKNAGSCWENGPNYNRWFKFTAISPVVTIDMKVAGAEGTLQHPNMALWESDGTTQLACVRRVNATTDVSIVYSSLVVGQIYYISCDNYVGLGYRGTFTLCIDNVSQTYYSFADGNWDTPGSWSATGHGGPAETIFYPTVGDVAYIQGHSIVVGVTETVAEVNMTAATATTALTIDNCIFNVSGKVTMVNPGNNVPASITTQNNGTLFINDNLLLNRAGGDQVFAVTVNTGSQITVNKELLWTSTGGSVTNNQLTLHGTGMLTVNQDLALNSAGGTLIEIIANNSSVIDVKRDITFTATASGQESMVFNNSSTLRSGRNIVRGGTPYGSITFGGTSTLELNGTTFLQTLAASAGSGGDAISYNNITVNNTRITTPQITLAGAVTVNGDLTLTAGLVSTTSTNILNLTDGSATTIGSTSSYIDGPMTYEIAATSATRNFPVGDGGNHRPLVLTVNHTDAAPVIYTTEHVNVSAQTLGYSLPPSIERVSGLRYWKVDRQAVANLTDARVRLYYGIGTSDGVTDYTNLTVVKNVGVGTAWVDVGGTATGNGSGSILSGLFTSFSDMTIANLVGGTNPLPVELLSFGASWIDGIVDIQWVTGSELNNDFFTVQRSADGFEFMDLFDLAGHGTTSEVHYYQAIDDQPLMGTNYYRLKQTDLGGDYTYSHIVKVEHGAGLMLRITPNPVEVVRAEITLSGLQPGELFELSIADLAGRVVGRERYVANKSGTFKGHLATNPAVGVYIVRAFTSNGIVATRLIQR
ncbi:MAG: T9SS type A sorting domain-containing protein [Cyclobacteriaceae bacterium]